MINITTAKRLDKLGIIKTGDNFSIGYAKHIYSRNVSIEELLELLPICVESDCSKRKCYLDMDRGKSGWWSVQYIDCDGKYLIKEIIHKYLAEALARLLIKLKEEGLI